MGDRGCFKLVAEPQKGGPLSDGLMQTCLKKWDMAKSTRIYRFRYDKHYHKQAVDAFLADFFADPVVQQSFEARRFHAIKAGGLTTLPQVMRKDGSWAPLGGPATEVAGVVVPASHTTLDVFDRLYTADPPILRENGAIVKRMDGSVAGFPVSDMLREMLLDPESDNAGLYSPTEQAELLYQLMSHVVLGGPMNQYDDDVAAYFDATKALYKALLTAQRDPATGGLHVAGVAYRVTSASGATFRLFPGDSRQNACYLGVDPLRRQVTVLYLAYLPYW